MRLLFTTAVAVIVASTATYAQDTQKPVLSASEAKQKPALLTRKVWTNDDVAPLRSQGKIQGPEKDGRTAETLITNADATKHTADLKPAQGGAPPALSNPKTLADADRMIAWENRDLEAQQEFVERLRNELHEAPVDQRERLQKLLEERIQILADIRKEKEALVTQRKELEKNRGGGSMSASSQPVPH